MFCGTFSELLNGALFIAVRFIETRKQNVCHFLTSKKRKTHRDNLILLVSSSVNVIQ